MRIHGARGRCIERKDAEPQGRARCIERQDAEPQGESSAL